jgi:hypothetical protein
MARWGLLRLCGRRRWRSATWRPRPRCTPRDRAETRDRYRGRRCVKGSVGGTVASGDHRPRRPPPEPLNVAFDCGIDRFEHFLQLSLGGEAPRVCIPGRHTRHGGNVVAVSRHRRQTRRLATRRFPDRAWSRAPDLRSGAPSPAGRPGRAVCTRMAAQAPVGGAGWLLAEPTRLPCHAELNSNAGEHLGSIR